MTSSPSALRRTLRTTALLGAAALGSVLVASPAAGAPPSGGPDLRASCVGQVFVPQATGEPGEVADRIHEIMEVDLPLYGGTFGEGISGLAHGEWCRGG